VKISEEIGDPIPIHRKECSFAAIGMLSPHYSPASGMKKSRYTEEQLVGILKESETGMATRVAPEA
jgi:hypothetical protein